MSGSTANETVKGSRKAPSRYPSTLLAGCCVPWNEDYSFAEELFRDEVRGLIADGLQDLYVFGTAGEGYAVSDAQFDAVVRAFRDETAGAAGVDVRPMVGVISLSLRTVVERIERAAGLGFRAFQISLPSWGTLNDAELDVFFQETCGRFPDLQFLHYNLPRAGRVLTATEYGPLVAAHPNLVAIKYGGSDLRLILGLVTRVPEVRHFLTEFGFIYGSLFGECGLLMSVSSVNVTWARSLLEAGLARDAGRLAAHQQQFTGAHGALVGAMRGMGGAAHMDGAYDKLYSRLRAPEFPLRLLPPYTGADEATYERFRTTLRTQFPEWLPAERARV